MINDPYSAFCTVDVKVPGAPEGPLAGLTFAAKDNFDVAGYPTGAGSPDWLRTHEPAEKTAEAVQALLDAGASLVGKTRMDELAFSLDGRNFHYGTPLNPRAPERIPGGSSSGSAVATAGGLVDFAVGTDTAGSVRVPANNCGVYGFRPTHGRVSLAGLVPFSPSFDTVGWFARDAALLRRVSRVLLGSARPSAGPTRLLIADDVFALADEEVRVALLTLLPAVAAVVGRAEHVTLSARGADAWVGPFGTLRGAEVRTSLGPWIERVRPDFGPGIRQRFLQTASITEEAIAAARADLRQFRLDLGELLDAGDVLCLPTAPLLAPRRDGTEAGFDHYRARTLALTCIATAGGVPQINLPVAFSQGCPVGLSLIAARAGDEQLIELAEAIESQFNG